VPLPVRSALVLTRCQYALVEEFKVHTYIFNPTLAANVFWWGFMCTSALGEVADDWSMYCMGGEL
jgi:hypothetical protein